MAIAGRARDAVAIFCYSGTESANFTLGLVGSPRGEAGECEHAEPKLTNATLNRSVVVCGAGRNTYFLCIFVVLFLSLLGYISLLRGPIIIFGRKGTCLGVVALQFYDFLLPKLRDELGLPALNAGVPL